MIEGNAIFRRLESKGYKVNGKDKFIDFKLRIFMFLMFVF